MLGAFPGQWVTESCMPSVLVRRSSGAPHTGRTELWSIRDGRGDQTAPSDLEESIMTTPIYLDYNATTPIDPAVADAIEPYLRDQFGNPSSDHVYGYQARSAVQTAREQLAALLGAAPEEVVFTGGGSEANNLAIKGVAYALHARGNHLITSAVEHPAVVGPLRFLERQGYEVTILPVDADGWVDPAQVAAAITDQTILVSI